MAEGLDFFGEAALPCLHDDAAEGGFASGGLEGVAAAGEEIGQHAGEGHAETALIIAAHAGIGLVGGAGGLDAGIGGGDVGVGADDQCGFAVPQVGEAGFF